MRPSITTSRTPRPARSPTTSTRIARSMHSSSPTSSRSSLQCAEHVLRVDGERRRFAHRLEHFNHTLNITHQIKNQNHKTQTHLTLKNNQITKTITINTTIIKQIHNLTQNLITTKLNNKQ